MNALALATVSILLAQGPLIEVPPPVDGIPQAPQLVEGLPQSEEVPTGTLLPTPLDDAVGDFMGYCLELPGLCQTAVTAAEERAKGECAGWILPAGLGFVAGVIATALVVAAVK